MGAHFHRRLMTRVDVLRFLCLDRNRPGWARVTLQIVLCADEGLSRRSGASGSTVTVSLRSVVITLGVAIAVLLAFWIGSTQVESAAATAAEAPVSVDEPTIVMTGTGEATGTPDQLKFSLAVRTTANDVSTAMESATAATRRVLAAIGDQGVAADDVQTTGMSVNSVSDYSGEGAPVITGYVVTESMSVVVRELPDAGATITAAVVAGGNAVRLHNVRLQMGDEDALFERARTAAIEEAQAKAEQYAAAAGSELGEVASIREVTSTSGGRSSYRLETAAVADYASVPIRAGTSDLNVTVVVVWSLD